ncbi:MAG: XdhC family protein, partial [Candidatus Bathyarchaeia archaeon]
EPLAKLSKLLGFRVVVVDFFAKKEDFPTADEVVSDDPDLARLKITPRTFVAVTTRHKYDEHALKSALSFNPAYVGLVASANRTEYIFKQITSEGFSEEKLRRVHAPAGLDIGANTPEEIALSILAEVVKVRRAGTGMSLVEVKRGMQPATGAAVAPEIPSVQETSESRGRKPTVC